MTAGNLDHMALTLDASSLVASLHGWKETNELKIPMPPGMAIQLMLSKAGNLKSLLNTVKAWRYVLTACQPNTTSQADFGDLMTEIDEFLMWAQFSLDELHALKRSEH